MQRSFWLRPSIFFESWESENCQLVLSYSSITVKALPVLRSKTPRKDKVFCSYKRWSFDFWPLLKKVSRERTTAVTSLLSKQWPLKWANGFLFWRPNKHALFYLRYWCIDTIRVLNVEESYFIIIKLTKPWTPNIFMEWYCVARKKPIKR